MRIIILITTYNRPHLLLDLLKDIKREMACNYKVKIYNDHSTEDYGVVIDYLRKNIPDYEYVYCDFRHNKHLFWKLHRRMYAEMRAEKFDYFIQLLDDTRLVKGFYPSVIDQYRACGAGVLNIMLPAPLNGLLAKQKIPNYSVNGFTFWRKKWIDLCFIATRQFLEKINYSCPPVSPERWKIKPQASSNVGTKLTFAYKGTVVIVGRSLLEHTGQVSQMNPLDGSGRKKTGYRAYV